ncbi:MAG: NUDIX hydrolase [Candidatus Micrarchaeota archaeon]
MTLLKQVQAIIVSKGNVLLLKKRDIKFKSGKWFRTKNSFWRLPKGKLEKGESAIKGLKRELKEETGLEKIKIGKKVFSYGLEAPKGLHRKVDAFLVFTEEKPRMTKDGREEGIEEMAFFDAWTAWKKLNFDSEKKSLKAAMAVWAADCAESVLHFFEKKHPGDRRPRKAIQAVRDWVEGKIKMPQAKKASLAAHAAARGTKDPLARAAARAAGQAAATAHSAGHALGTIYYAEKCRENI